jgi:hypothetical protein
MPAPLSPPALAGRHHLLLLAAALTLAACGGPDAPADAGPAETSDETASPAAAFLANLNIHCGQAFPGRLAIEPPGDEMLDDDDRLIVHMRGCGEEEMLLPFHIEKASDGSVDRSRTWIYRLHDGNRLELRHDHRQEDGTEDEVTWYGAFTLADGSPTQQEFLREEPGADGLVRGWRVIIEPGVRYVYGTIRGDEWTWRVDFDLSSPLDELPPPPWGYEGGQGPPR